MQYVYSSLVACQLKLYTIRRREHDGFGTKSIRQCKSDSHVNNSVRNKASACAPDVYNVSSIQASAAIPSISNGTMKLLAAVLTLSASLSLGHAANFCAVPAPKSCADLPQSSADACSSLIGEAFPQTLEPAMTDASQPSLTWS